MKVACMVGTATATSALPVPPTPRILVVDDDPIIRKFNIRVLQHSGYEVDSAEDGVAAWETLQQRDYSLLITDNEMPKRSGMELLVCMHEASMRLPAIMATGAPPILELARYPWLQPAATLIKPYSIQQLLMTVQDVLQMPAPVTDQVQ